MESAQSLGARPGRIMRTHVLPNVASPVIIQVALALGFALLAEAGLAFLGIGAQPPTPSWGDMLNEAYQFIFQAPLALVFPGLAIMLSVLSFNAVADGLRDAIGAGSTGTAGRGVRTRLRERRAARAAVLDAPVDAVLDRPVPIDAVPPPDSTSNGRAPAVAAGGGPARPSHLLDVDSLPRRVRHRRGVMAGGGGPLVLRRTRSDAGPGGRERVRQDGLGAGHHGSAPPSGGPGHPGFGPVRGKEPPRAGPKGPPRGPWRPDRHDLPGPDDQPESGLLRRQPDRRAGAGPPGRQPYRSQAHRGRDAGSGRDPRGGLPRRRTIPTSSRAACASG